MKCKYCGQDIDDASLFCGYCGKQQPKVKTCIKCSKELEVEDRWCGYCGAVQIIRNESIEKDLIETPTSTSNDTGVKSSKISKKIIIGGIVIILVLIGFGIYYAKSGLQFSNLSVSDSSDCDSTVACVDIQEDSDIDAKISFFKEYFNRYEVKESGDERYNSYTEDMRNNRIDLGCISAFSLAEEGTGICDASLSVTHKEGDCFFVSYHGDNINSDGNIPTAKWIVEIVSENGEYKINDINYYDVTPNKIAGRWMAWKGMRTTYIFNFNKDGSGDCYAIYIPSAYEQENGERTEITDKKLFQWSASKQSISINYNNGDKENICVDEESPWWESAFEDKCHWEKFANL